MVMAIVPLHSFAVGTWVPVYNQAPDFIDTMLLMPDGTVMAAAGEPVTEQSTTSSVFGQNWYRLTPDANGSYANGTWTALASMHYPRLYYSSQVLTNGQVFVAGGEYSTAEFAGPGTTNGEIYDPVANAWTLMPSTPGLNKFYDSISDTLPNGNVIVSPVTPSTFGGTLIWNTAANTWSAGPKLFRGDDQDEASWVKLPDNSILTIDPYGTNSERYIPSLNKWVNDTNVPVTIYDPNQKEMGAGLLLTNGQAFFVGGTGNTAFYTPNGTTNVGMWTAGPSLPNSYVAGDAPAAMMVNGKALYVLSSAVYADNNYFYEYNTTANTFTPVSTPSDIITNSVTFGMRMLDLPDGTVLLSDSYSQLFVYQPDGSPLAAGKPTINTFTTNSDGSYHLTGTLFNGISEGAAYGDDGQMNSDYPLVRMTNFLGGVFYARTRNWNSTSVMTGTNIVGTDFVLPSGFPQGIYSLVVVANGNASAPMRFVYSLDSLLVATTNSLTFSGSVGGPFTPSSAVFTLTNIGPASLNWAVGNTSSWLNVSSSNGALTPGGAVKKVTVTLNANANHVPSGGYPITLWFTNLSDHFVESETFRLNVNLVQNGGFETGDFTDWSGTATTDFDADFVADGSFYYIDPHSGNDVALMGAVGGPDYLSQTLSTTNGQNYLFSSWVNSPDAVTPNVCSISWNGTTLFDQANMPQLVWTNLQYIVTATGSSTVIQFGMEDDTSFLGLDDISVTALYPPAFQSAVNANGSYNLTWSAQYGPAYQLQYKTNLLTGSWLNLGNPLTLTNGAITATDIAPSDPRRFYRIILAP